jgi:hypothetical protein
MDRERERPGSRRSRTRLWVLCFLYKHSLNPLKLLAVYDYAKVRGPLRFQIVFV